MDSELVTTLITALAPSVATKLMTALPGRKVSSEELSVVILAILAEQSSDSVRMMKSVEMHMLSLGDCMCSVGEGVAVLLKRTER